MKIKSSKRCTNKFSYKLNKIGYNNKKNKRKYIYKCLKTKKSAIVHLRNQIEVKEGAKIQAGKIALSRMRRVLSRIKEQDALWAGVTVLIIYLEMGKD